MELETYESLVDALDRSGLEKRVIGNAIGRQPMYCLRAGGDRLPSVLITAGAHADEPAGVFGVVRLLSQLRTNHATYIIPCRDPMGWGGYNRYLGFALGTRISLLDHQGVERILHEAGDVVYEKRSFLVALIGDIGFATMDPSEEIGSWAIMRRLSDLLKAQPDVVERLRGKRVILPANAPGCPGCEEFDRAYTTFVTDTGRVANLNRLFSAEQSVPEVDCVRALVDTVKPGLTLDCHEGFGDKFYLFTTFSDEPRWIELAQSITGAVTSRGLPLARLRELSREMGPDTVATLTEIGDGILAHRPSSELDDSLSGYCGRYGPSFTLESGMFNSLERRADFQVWGVLAALDTWQRQNMLQ